jgi:hypothetical protein
LLSHTLSLTNVHNSFHIFLFVKSWNITRVKDVIDILKHLLVNNLSVDEQEGSGLSFNSSLGKASLQVVSPVSHGVPFNDLNLVKLEAADVSGKLTERLSSRTSDTKQKSISLWLSEHSANSVDMVTSVQEHNKFHWILLAIVVVAQVLDNDLHECVKILNHDVWSILSINAIQVITEDDSLTAKDLFFSKFVDLCALLHDEVKKDFFVLVGNHSVSEDSLILVDPKSNDINLSLSGLLIGRANTLENLGDVSQVESVVGLGRSWSQVVSDSVVDLDGRLHQVCALVGNFWLEASYECLNDLLEDHSDGFVV